MTNRQCLWRFQSENVLAQRGAKCIMARLTVGFPHEALRVRKLTTGKILFLQAVAWHAYSSEKQGVMSPCAKSAANYRCHAPRHADITGFYPKSDHLGRIPEREKTKALGNEVEDGKLESAGLEEGGSGSGPEGSGFDGEPAKDESSAESDESDEELDSGAQEVPIGVGSTP